MTAEEKIVKIEETKKELLQFTIAEIADCVADIEEMIHDIYDVVEE